MVWKQNLIVFFLTVFLRLAQSTVRENELLLRWDHNVSAAEASGPIISKRCKDQKICGRVKNYPIDLAKIILKKLETKKITKFTIDNLKLDDNGDYEDICSHGEEIYYPQAAKNYNGTWHFILNGGSSAFQGFYVQLCKKGCSLTDLPFSSDYELKCVQKTIFRKMVYIDLDRKTLAIDNFEVPACCSCSLLEVL